MPRLTEATAAKRRMHILQATMRCLFEKGLTAMSVDDVCAAAGISKGAFYSHFPSKEALLYAVTELLSSELGPLESDSIEALAASIFERRVAPALPPPNARFGIGAQDQRWMLEFWGTNITDEEYVQVGFDGPLQNVSPAPNNPFNTFNAFLGAPRMYGMTLRVRY